MRRKPIPQFVRREVFVRRGRVAGAPAPIVQDRRAQIGTAKSRPDGLKNHAVRKFMVELFGKLAREPRLANAGRAVHRCRDGGASSWLEQIADVINSFDATHKAGFGARRRRALPITHTATKRINFQFDAVELIGDFDEQRNFLSKGGGKRENKTIVVDACRVFCLCVVQVLMPVVEELLLQSIDENSLVNRLRQCGGSFSSDSI